MGSLETPLTLEFDIPVTGGEFYVSYGVYSSATAYAAPPNTALVDSGGMAVHVIAFEIEALE